MLRLCHKAILITIIKTKKTAGENPFWSHHAHLALWSGGKWEVGGREHMPLTWASTFQMKVLKIRVSVACRIRRTPDFFHRCTHRHSVSCLEAFIHLFNKCSPRISNVPGTVLGAGNTAGDKTE